MKKYIVIGAALAATFAGFYWWTTTMRTYPDFTQANVPFKMLVSKVCPEDWNQAKWNGAKVNCDGYSGCS